MADVAMEAGASVVRAQGQKRTAPIVPERSVAGRTLVLLIAIMTFLSGVTLGGVVLVQKSAVAWSADVGREVTIQLRPDELGRIDVRMEVGKDGQVSAHIRADKPETLDLLQRDARGLERVLQDAGLRTDGNSLSFGLRGDNGAQGQGSGRPQQGVVAETPEETTAPLPVITRTADGRVFLVENFQGQEALADSINHLLLVGFYLVNIGFVALALRYGVKPTNLVGAFEFLSTKVGLVVVVLGLMHFFNMRMLVHFRTSKLFKIFAPAT